MPSELISPELALVDPELRARAQAAMPDRPSPPPPRPHPVTRPRSPAAAAPAPAATPEPQRAARVAYPLWARVAATLWILVVGVLIGGAAVPHAQDRPRVVPRAEDAAFCELPRGATRTPLPTRPIGPTDGPRVP